MDTQKWWRQVFELEEKLPPGQAVYVTSIEAIHLGTNATSGAVMLLDRRNAALRCTEQTFRPSTAEEIEEYELGQAIENRRSAVVARSRGCTSYSFEASK